MNAKELSAELSRRAADVAAYLLPNGKKHGPEWRVGSADGEAGKSLSVRIGGDRRGVWSDFATGEGGDLLDLFCASGDTGSRMPCAKRCSGPAFATTSRASKRQRECIAGPTGRRRSDLLPMRCNGFWIAG